jgi:hypothetical protein
MTDVSSRTRNSPASFAGIRLFVRLLRRELAAQPGDPLLQELIADEMARQLLSDLDLAEPRVSSS